MWYLIYAEKIILVKMRVIIKDDADKVAEWAAKYVMKKIKDFNPGPNKYFVLGLPTGKYCFFLLR